MRQIVPPGTIPETSSPPVSPRKSSLPKPSALSLSTSPFAGAISNSMGRRRSPSKSGELSLSSSSSPMGFPLSPSPSSPRTKSLLSNSFRKSKDDESSHREDDSVICIAASKSGDSTNTTSSVSETEDDRPINKFSFAHYKQQRQKQRSSSSAAAGAATTRREEEEETDIEIERSNAIVWKRAYEEKLAECSRLHTTILSLENALKELNVELRDKTMECNALQLTITSLQEALKASDNQLMEMSLMNEQLDMQLQSISFVGGNNNDSRKKSYEDNDDDRKSRKSSKSRKSRKKEKEKERRKKQRKREKKLKRKAARLAEGKEGEEDDEEDETESSSNFDSSMEMKEFLRELYGDDEVEEEEENDDENDHRNQNQNDESENASDDENDDEDDDEVLELNTLQDLSTIDEYGEDDGTMMSNVKGNSDAASAVSCLTMPKQAAATPEAESGKTKTISNIDMSSLNAPPPHLNGPAQAAFYKVIHERDQARRDADRMSHELLHRREQVKTLRGKLTKSNALVELSYSPEYPPAADAKTVTSLTSLSSRNARKEKQKEQRRSSLPANAGLGEIQTTTATAEEEDAESTGGESSSMSKLPIRWLMKGNKVKSASAVAQDAMLVFHNRPVVQKVPPPASLYCNNSVSGNSSVSSRSFPKVMNDESYFEALQNASSSNFSVYSTSSMYSSDADRAAGLRPRESRLAEV